jgi:sulfur-carrier protein
VIKVVYFAWVRDAIGMAEEMVTPPSSVVTLSDLGDFLAVQSAGHARAFADRARLRCAVDLVMVDFDAPVAGVKEIAFFPPVTGG